VIRTARLEDGKLERFYARRPLGDPMNHAETKLIAFDSAPFPLSGTAPLMGNDNRQAQPTRRAARGKLLRHRGSYNDPRVLVHIPKGFDIGRPGVMVVFFHGHGATLTRDVLARQQVPAQISASGINAVLVAPQLAVDAADSSPGKLAEPGG